MSTNNKLKKYLIIGALFFLAFKVLDVISKKKQKAYQFSGLIEKIDYNEKKTPTVVVNGKSYGLSTSWMLMKK
jgi:hypothetical protein